VSRASARTVSKSFRSATLRSIFIAVDTAGWRWRVGGDHIVVYPPDKTLRPMILSGTAYDGAAMDSVLVRFRKAGLDI
jgi:hypothetical protein